MLPRIVVVLLLACAIAIACDDGADPPADTAALDLAALDLRPSHLTIDEVRMRASEVLQRPGKVLHVTEVRRELDSGLMPSLSLTYELWVDRDRNAARLDLEGVPAEPAVDGQRSSTVDEVESAFTDSPLRYLSAMRNDVEGVEIGEAEIDDEDLTVVKFDRRVRLADESWLTHWIVVFDSGSFLPMFTREGAANSALEFEFVDRADLPEEFFDKRAVLGLDESPRERLEFALDTDFQAYWLGERFRNLELSEVSGERAPNKYYRGHRFVRVDYAITAIGNNGYPCNLRIFPPVDFAPRLGSGLPLIGIEHERRPTEVLRAVDLALGEAEIVKEYELIATYDFTAPPLPSSPPFAGVTPSVLDRLVVPTGVREESSISGRIVADGVPVEILLRCERDEAETLALLSDALEALRPFPD